MTSKQCKQLCAEKFKRFPRTSIGTRKIALTVSATAVIYSYHVGPNTKIIVGDERSLTMQSRK